jgi:hypothetical protein
MTMNIASLKQTYTLVQVQSKPLFAGQDDFSFLYYSISNPTQPTAQHTWQAMYQQMNLILLANNPFP